MEKKTQAFLSFLLNSTNDHRKRLSSRICGACALHKTTTRGSSSFQKRTSFCTRRKRGREKEMRFQRSLAVVFPRIRNKFQSQASRYFSSQLESEQRFVWSILKSFVNSVLYTNNNGNQEEVILENSVITFYRSSFGIAFDIDGVILRGRDPIGGSPQAMRRLYGDSGALYVYEYMYFFYALCVHLSSIWLWLLPLALQETWMFLFCSWQTVSYLNNLFFIVIH